MRYSVKLQSLRSETYVIDKNKNTTNYSIDMQF